MKAFRSALQIIIVLLAIFPAPSFAHKPSDSYLTLKVTGNQIDGQWDVAFRDLDFAIGLDENGDGKLTWHEVRAKHADIAAYLLSRLRLSTDATACQTNTTSHLIDEHTDGAYEVLRFHAECASPIDALRIQYSLFFDIDPQHRGLLQLSTPQQTSTAVFSPDSAEQNFNVNKSNLTTQFLSYMHYGIWHIWTGFDHILFLMSLLFPAVLCLNKKTWHPADTFRTSLMDVLKVVTAFTLAHSITLTLAALQVIALPSRWVESAIAFSVIVAALNNIVPMFQGSRWIVAFVFGLIHGFGFASVLTDLGLPQHALLLALVGFNLGIEIGQLLIVALFLPIAYWIRKTQFYKIAVLHGGSFVVIVVAGIWLAERAFDIRLITP